MCGQTVRTVKRFAAFGGYAQWRWRWFVRMQPEDICARKTTTQSSRVDTRLGNWSEGRLVAGGAVGVAVSGRTMEQVDRKRYLCSVGSIHT